MNEVICMEEIRPEHLSDIYSELCSIVGIARLSRRYLYTVQTVSLTRIVGLTITT